MCITKLVSTLIPEIDLIAISHSAHVYKCAAYRTRVNLLPLTIHVRFGEGRTSSTVPIILLVPVVTLLQSA
jgi:hypothetical protein